MPEAPRTLDAAWAQSRGEYLAWRSSDDDSFHPALPAPART